MRDHMMEYYESSRDHNKQNDNLRNKTQALASEASQKVKCVYEVIYHRPRGPKITTYSEGYSDKQAIWKVRNRFSYYIKIDTCLIHHKVL